jgi:hypothetical protein
MIIMRVFQTRGRADVAMMMNKGKEISFDGGQGKANHLSDCEAGRQRISRC